MAPDSALRVYVDGFTDPWGPDPAFSVTTAGSVSSPTAFPRR